MLRRIPIVLVVLVASPAILAGGFGIWTELGALQQHRALDLLLDLLLWMESYEPRTSRVPEGLIAAWEVPLIVGGAGGLIFLARWWERIVPRLLHPIIDLPEMALAALGLVAVGAVLAVGAAIDRTVFWGGIAVCVLAGRAVVGRLEPSTEEGGWRARSNWLPRTAVAIVAAGGSYYAVTSLWEGATYRNPLFRISQAWIDGPGSSPWTSGGAWLLAGGSLAAAGLWLTKRRRPRAQWDRRILGGAAAVAGITLILQLLRSPDGARAVASVLSALGLLGLAAGLGPRVFGRRFAPRHALTALDPRQVLSFLLPFVAWSGLCILRGFTVLMWTPTPALPVGVEQLADAACVFSLSSEPETGTIWFTDRCRTEVGRIAPDGQVRTWDLRERGAQQVEEMGGPDATGTLWTSVAAYIPGVSQLVMLAVEGELGPRTVLGDEGNPRQRTAADEQRADLNPWVPMANCWSASWVPIPGSTEVLVGCENRAGAVRFAPVERTIVDDQIQLTTRMETGAFSASGETLYGLSLWDDPRLVSWSWPALEEEATRVIGPFNWTVVAVPEPASIWVSRFVEGQVLILDPTTLETMDRVRLSFGIRAMVYDPVRDRLWAAASYSGKLWEIDPTSHHRRSWAICGETRDLTTDALGRVVVSTDCGVFRVDPEAE